jgi:hypothetical protein
VARLLDHRFRAMRRDRYRWIGQTAVEWAMTKSLVLDQGLNRSPAPR